MKLNEEKEICGVCDHEKNRGIHLYNLFICCECEQKMVHTEPSEEQYKFYLEKLKHMNQPKLYS